MEDGLNRGSSEQTVLLNSIINFSQKTSQDFQMKMEWNWNFSKLKFVVAVTMCF